MAAKKATPGRGISKAIDAAAGKGTTKAKVTAKKVTKKAAKKAPKVEKSAAELTAQADAAEWAKALKVKALKVKAAEAAKQDKVNEKFKVSLTAQFSELRGAETKRDEKQAGVKELVKDANKAGVPRSVIKQACIDAGYAESTAINAITKLYQSLGIFARKGKTAKAAEAKKAGKDAPKEVTSGAKAQKKDKVFAYILNISGQDLEVAKSLALAAYNHFKQVVDGASTPDPKTGEVPTILPEEGEAAAVNA
jgi:hypothetical protein